MDKDELIRKVNDPKYIPGIYNYCDRWCARCSFSSRCLNFEISEEQFSTPESRDIHNKEFWNRLSDLFSSTLKMVQEDLEERGIDISNMDFSDVEEHRDRIKENSKNHQLSIMSEEYIDKTNKWFERSEDFFKLKNIDLEKLHEIGVQNIGKEKVFVAIADAIEIIYWYQHQIHVKLRRALNGKQEEASNPDAYEGFPSDADGSAKVALIGIDRSMAAWGKLYKQFPEKEDSILDILVLLERLRKFSEKEFPKARAFVRPGFDEV